MDDLSHYMAWFHSCIGVEDAVLPCAVTFAMAVSTQFVLNYLEDYYKLFLNTITQNGDIFHTFNHYKMAVSRHL